MKRDVSLLRNWRFQVLWVGAAAAFTGVQIVTIAYPLLILSITGSAGLAGAFSAVQLCAVLLLGIPAGGIVDRYDRRRVLIIGEAVRVLAAASVAVAVAMHDINYVHLLAVAAVTGAIQPFTGSARMLATRAIVPAGQLSQALSQEQVRDNAAQLLGPSIAGSLFSLGRALPFFANAAGFLVSLGCAIAVRFDSPQRARVKGRSGAEGNPAADSDTEVDPGTGETPRRRGEVFAGLSLLWHNSLLRTVLVSILVVNLIVNPLDLVTIVLARHDGVANGYVGMVFAGFAVGGLLGAPLVSRIHAILQPGELLMVVLAAFSVGVAAMALPLGAIWLAGCLVFSGLGVPALLVLLDILIFTKVADEKRGRVITATTTLMVAGQPVGSALGGLFLQYLSPTTTVLIMAAGLAATVIMILPRRELRAARWGSA